MENNMNERIRLLRKALNIYQGDFAKRIGLSQTSLSLIESGHNVLNDRHIKLICSTFNVNERWLRDGEGEMFAAASPYAKELEQILDSLAPATQEYLLVVARELLTMQEKLLGKEILLFHLNQRRGIHSKVGLIHSSEDCSCKSFDS